jgi:ATP-dependent DNA helicase RecQ
MLEQAQRVLKDVFGYDSFRGRQAAIIECVANGGDALVLMPTGGGKSLCFQVPGLLRPGLTVVVSPLIALMADQVATLTNGVLPRRSTPPQCRAAARTGRAPAPRRGEDALPGARAPGTAAHAGFSARPRHLAVRHR